MDTRFHRNRTAILRLLASVCLFLCAPAIPALAQTRTEASRYNGWKIISYTVRGMPDGLAGGVKGGLALSGHRRWIFQHRYPVFSSAQNDEDKERIRLFLARSGYPWARVNPEFKPDTRKRAVAVTLVVDHGPAVRVEKNTTEAFPPSLEPNAASVLALEPNEVFNDTKVEDRHKRLLEILSRAGYARAEIATDIEPTGDSTKVVVEFIVDAGQIYYFGDTHIKGVGTDLDDVVKRTVAIRPGTRYNPDLVERGSQNLRLLDLLSRIRLTLEPPRADTLDVLADITERPPRSLEVSGGYWTEEQIQAHATWKHRNLLRAGRGMGAELSYSRFKQNASLSLWKPGMFHSRFRGIATLSARRENELNYNLLAGDLTLSGSYVKSLAVTLRPSLMISRIDFRSIEAAGPAIQNPGRSLVALALGWTYDTLDDKIYPHRGTYSTVEPEYGRPSFRAKNDYLRLRPEVTHYLPVGPVTLAGRLRVGYVALQNDALDLLPDKRFYAGGSGSVRGFQRHMLGPLDSKKNPIGGVASVESSMEVQFPLFWLLTGAVFLDAGQVWDKRGQFNLGTLAYAAGPGIGIRTPVGPIRLDWGYRLTSVTPSRPRNVLSLSVGHVM